MHDGRAQHIRYGCLLTLDYHDHGILTKRGRTERVQFYGGKHFANILASL